MEITPQIILNTFLSNVQNQEQQVTRLQNQISTGNAFQRPWDNPTAVTTSMVLTNALEQVSQYKTSAHNAQNWLNQTNGVLNNAISLWDSVLSTAVQAANGTNNSGDTTALAATITEDQKSLGQLLNARYQGEPLFTGTTGQDPIPPGFPSSIASWPVSSGSGNKEFQIGQASQVTINLTGFENVGQPTGQSYFQILYNDLGQLVKNIQTGPSAVAQQLSSLQQDLSYLTTAQSLIGARLQRVNNTLDQLHTANFDIKQSLSQTQGANIPQVTAQLAQEEEAYQATLQSGARVLSLSLLNFLNP